MSCRTGWTKRVEELLKNTYAQPAFNLANAQNMRISIPLGPIFVSVFESHWSPKEKVRMQYEQGP